MKKWNIYYENFKLPFRVMCFALVLMALGSLVHNENLNVFYTIQNTYVLLFAEAALRIGETLLKVSPLLFLLAFVCKRANSGSPVLMAILGFVSFEVATMIFTTGNFPQIAYGTLFGISYDATGIPVSSNGLRYPLNTGMMGVFLVALATRYSYVRSRNRSTYSLFGFMHKDTVGLFYNMIFCGILGFLVALCYPSFYAFLGRCIHHIGKDLSNPINMAAYGFLDRFLSILQVPDLIREPFWFNALGGTYQSIAGQNILGDVSIWSYFAEAKSSFAGAGRFITPYYCLNIFVLPCMYIGIFQSISNRKERHKKIWILLLTILVTVLSGSPLPLEYLLLLSAPLLLVAYLLLVMMLFAILPMNAIYMGFNFSGSSTVVALPGSFPDYIINLRNPSLFYAVVGIAVVGVITGVVAYLCTRVYYSYFAFDMFHTGKAERFIENLAEAVGGYENIERSTSSFLRINLSLKDLEAVSYEKIEKLGARRLTETRSGVNLEVGSGAYLLAKCLQKKIVEIKRV